MTHSAEFMVLDVTKIGEKSLVIHSLSRQWGRRSFLCSVSRGMSMALFMPMNILEGEVSENPKSDLWRVRNVSVRHPLNGIRGDFSKNCMTLFMSEVLYRTIKDGANEEGLFDWCCASVLTLEAMQSDYANYHLRFLMEFAAVLGFSPAEGDIAPFAGECLRDIRQLMSLPFAESMLLPLNGARRNEIADALLRYIAHNAETSLNIRSLAVLREVFGQV